MIFYCSILVSIAIVCLFLKAIDSNKKINRKDKVVYGKWTEEELEKIGELYSQKAYMEALSRKSKNS